MEEAVRARELVMRMCRKYYEGNQACRPDVAVFTALIQVYGKVMGERQDYDRALGFVFEAMDEMKGGKCGEVSHAVYSGYMKAVNQLCQDKDQRLEILQSTFAECAAAGHVSKQVVISMKIGAWNGDLPELKAEWSRRVPFRSKAPPYS